MIGRLRVSIVGPHDAPEPSGLARFIADAGHDVEIGPAVRRRGPDPDVVVAVDPPLRAVGAALRWTGRTAVGVTVRGPVRGRAQRHLLRRADGVVAVHETVGRSLVELGVPAERITTIRSWSPEVEAHGDPATLRRDFGWRPDEIVALLPGPVEAGAETLVGAASVAAELGLPVRFVLVGTGDRRLALEHLGRGLPTLQFLGPLCPVASTTMMAAADVLVLSGQSAVPASSFAAGRPIVAATSPGSAAALDLEASGAGLCCATGGSAELVETVLRVGADREEALAMGLRAQLFARDAVSEPAVRRAYVTWVEGLARVTVGAPAPRRAPRRCSAPGTSRVRRP